MEFPRLPAASLFDDRGEYSAAANVARGAAWLDQEFPGWERQIDLSILDICDPSACVCGQVVPQEMVDAYALTQGAPPAYFTGYSIVAHEETPTSAYGFAGGEHTDHWVALIKERFDSGLLSDDG